MSPQDQQSVNDTPAVAAPSFDEAHHADGGVREHWAYVLDSLQELGEKELGQRRQTLERILRDDGATYNDYSAGLTARPWTLDPVPLLLDSQEWNLVEAGLRERAELMNLVLRDLYGERSLLHQGVIPPELVYSHPGFLRECQGVFLPGEQQLIQYAADMVRAPDGRITVMSDRAQTPSGTGYALENRLAMSRVFPSLFRDSHVHRLSHYFNSLRVKLHALNPNSGAARVAVLTPGAYNETYFEHVFLANYLGYQLVQGSDLTVRDGYLWLKTLDGLSRIDVLLRRVDDVYCDPVELKSDSRLGVPGLLEVMRLGNVSVVNPLGSGILENRGLARYLPAAARHFLGRDLRLNSAATYWCGDTGDRAYVLDHLPELVIKATYRGPGFSSVPGNSLDEAELAALRDTILANPQQFVAQEHLQPSSAPVWSSGQTVPLPLVLRGFAVASDSSYTVMPGGLTRVGSQPGTFEITNRLGSLSKDTWVLASEPERRSEAAPTPATGPLAQRGARMELPSRVVENLFWVGRYTERAEAALRLMRTVFSKLHQDAAMTPQSRALLLRAVTHMTGTYPGFLEDKTLTMQPEKELLSVVLDAERRGSVFYSLHAMLSAVAQTRDYMSADTQRILNSLSDAMAILPRKLRGGFNAASDEALGALVTAMLALSGLAKESMVRGQGWHFLDMGRRIERALQTISLLRSLWVPFAPGEDADLALETALLSAESLMTYRRRYQGEATIASGLDLLLLESTNPRALIYQLDRLSEHLASLPPTADGGRLTREARLLLEATASLRLADLGTLATVGEGAFLRSDLDQLLSRIQRLVSDTASVLSDKYFDHTSGPQPMSTFDPQSETDETGEPDPT